MRLKIQLSVLLAGALLLSACFEKKPGDAGGAVANAEPTISGVPPTGIRIGERYTFTPNASDPDGDALTFRISNKPSWASFDETTGRLAGTPREADAGIDANISISVSDGNATADLEAFSIQVIQAALGSVTLSWVPPTQNADGSVLIDLAGYQIYFGRNANMLDHAIRLGNTGLTRYVIEGLAPARWYFSMTSFNSQGIESERSPIASKTIS